MIAVVSLLSTGCPTHSNEGDGTTGTEDADESDAGRRDTVLGADFADMPADWPDRDLADQGPSEPNIVECPNDAIPVASEGICEVTAVGFGLTVLRGTVLAPGRVLHNAYVVYDDDGIIQCADCDCSNVAGFEEATVVSCSDGVISPGLINTHDHLDYSLSPPLDHGTEIFDARPEWRGGLNGHTDLRYRSNPNDLGNYWGELRMLLSGVTSIVGPRGQPGLLRNLDYDQEGLNQGEVDFSTFPLDDIRPYMRDDGCEYGDRADDAADVAEVDAYLPHIAEGISHSANNEFYCTSREGNGANDLLESKTAIIHAIGLTAADAVEIALEGAKIIWSPRSNIDLYGNTASVTLLHRLGVTIALGTDWSISGSMNIFRELACADRFNERYLGGYFSDAVLFQMVTEWGALATATDDVIGTLAAGQIGDIAIFNGSARPDYRAIIGGNVRDVVLVMRAGLAIYGDEALLEDLLASTAECEPLAVCGVDKTVCLERETGMTLSELTTAVEGSPYPLFFCGPPEGEPSCTPFRPGEYDGEVTDEDIDGDGVANEMDNCASIFNPPRPMDDGVQPDFDDDGIGDVCDRCPLDEDNSRCNSADPDDRDGDGIPAADDNCPNDANPEQADEDEDGTGDSCDLCPETYNEAGEPCPFEITQLRDTTMGLRPPNGTPVLVSEAVVTSLHINVDRNRGFHMQALEGGDYSGIFVYTQDVPADSGGTLLSIGDVVDVSGQLDSYSHIDQIARPEITIVRSGQAVTPLVVDPADLQADGTTGEALESMLVRVEGVYPIRFYADPPTQDGAEDDFYVSDNPDETCEGDSPPCALVGDFLFDGGNNDNDLPTVVLGRRYSSITGIVNGFYDEYFLDVRTLDDIVE
jgi:cytosine/adenosine deaminase-related metal-dependent hydrolase